MKDNVISKYIKLLNQLIETLYPNLKFDIFVRHRDPKIKHVDWYGYTYLELKIYDIILTPMYDPSVFDPKYKSIHYDSYISGHSFFNDINSYIPEINKHLAISFVPVINPYIEKHNMDLNCIPTFECWGEYFAREYHDDARSFGYIN